MKIARSQFQRNEARARNGAGGAIYALKGHKCLLNDCVFNENKANYIGGAVYAMDLIRSGETRPEGSSLQLVNLRGGSFFRNQAMSGGGAIAIDEGVEIWIRGGVKFKENFIGKKAQIANLVPDEFFGGDAVWLYAKRDVSPKNRPRLKMINSDMPDGSIFGSMGYSEQVKVIETNRVHYDGPVKLIKFGQGVKFPE